MVTQTTVSTDAQDYPPGAWTEITATGFDPGSIVTFQVQHAGDPGADGIWGTLDDVIVDLGGEGHEAWSVEDGSELDLDGAVNGAVVTSWYVNPDDSLNWHFLLTAMAADQQTASAGFTDAAAESTNKVYQHWADGDAATVSSAEWNNNILNANKSDYFEGEVIPHVFIYKASSQVPLVNGQSYSFNVTYNYYQQNTDALGFDYLTTFNTSRTPGQLGVTNPAITPTLDNSFTNNGGFTEFGSVSPGIYTLDANITSVSGITTSGSGNLDHTVTITFTYTGATTSKGVAEIYYGLHLAGPSATDKGASAWTGGSLQTTVDIGGSGATSLQLSPAAIIAGSISGVKFNDLDGDGIRDAGESGIDGVTIYLDLNNDGQLNGNDVSQITASGGLYSFSVTPDADKSTTANDPYIVREVVPAGWTQTTANPAPITISATTPAFVNINFGNREQSPSLTIVKEVDKTSVNAAGTVLTYTITVDNTGNVDLTNVVLTDEFATATLESGDLDHDSALDVEETWVYKASHVVTQAEINAGSDIVNVAKVDTDQTTEQQDDASTIVTQTPRLLIEKQVSINGIDWVDADTGTGPTATPGATLYFRVMVSNAGNVDLTSVDVTDKVTQGAGTPLNFTFGDLGSQTVNVDAGTSVVSNVVQTTAQSGQHTDLATASAIFHENVVSASDYANYFGKTPITALIAPTSTTIQQYLSGTAQTFQDYYSYQGGDIQYSVKAGKISQTNPGVFFYFTGLSGSIKGVDADNKDGVDSLSLTIDQSRSGTTSMFGIANNGIQLYKVNDLNTYGTIDATDTVTTVSLKSNQIIFGSGATAGDITINFTPDKVDTMYMLSVKYTTGSVVGNAVSSPFPTVHYDFATKVNGSQVETYAAGVDLARKPVTAMMLEGESGGGAKAVKAVQISHVVNAAVSWWDEHIDLTDAQLAKLKAATIDIDNLGGGANSGWILGENDGDNIMIDDDAAGHGWSLGLGNVAQNKVDLFSVLVHEMGHVLGKTDEQMGASLAVGERMLPMTSNTPPGNGDDQHGAPPSTDHGRPDVDQLLALVGSDTAAHQIALHMS